MSEAQRLFERVKASPRAAWPKKTRQGIAWLTHEPVPCTLGIVCLPLYGTKWGWVPDVWRQGDGIQAANASFLQQLEHETAELMLTASLLNYVTNALHDPDSRTWTQMTHLSYGEQGCTLITAGMRNHPVPIKINAPTLLDALVVISEQVHKATGNKP